jgi:hypothetical protein
MSWADILRVFEIFAMFAFVFAAGYALGSLRRRVVNRWRGLRPARRFR